MRAHFHLRLLAAAGLIALSSLHAAAENSATLAESYKATPISPMPPMRLILKPQEFEDVKEFLKTLK